MPHDPYLQRDAGPLRDNLQLFDDTVCHEATGFKSLRHRLRNADFSNAITAYLPDDWLADKPDAPFTAEQAAIMGLYSHPPELPVEEGATELPNAPVGQRTFRSATITFATS